jgi:hypothetical protein
VSDEVNSLHCHFHCQGPQYWVVTGAPLFQVGARERCFKFWPLLDIFIYTQSDIWWAVSSESKNCPTLVCSSVGQVWLSRSTHLVLMVGNSGSPKIKITSLSVVSNPKRNINLATSRFQTVPTLCFSHKMCNTTRVFFPGVANSMFPLVNCVNYIHVIVTPEIFHPSLHLKLLRVTCSFEML